MASKVSIANRALSKLGEERILLLTETTKAARVINAMFDDVLDAELRANRWKFAIKRDSLPALVEAPPWGFAYKYPLPSDYLALVQINDIYIRTGTPEGLWAIESGHVLTNLAAPLKIRYVSKVTNPGLFDPLFAEALACKIALESCETLTQSETKYNRCAEGYKYAISEARRLDGIEKVPDELPRGSWLDSREGGGIYTTASDTGMFPSGVTVL